MLDDVCKRYYEGVQWILFYYYRGVQSWGWYYPYHYAPLASDLATYDMCRFAPLLTRRHFQPFSLDAPFSPFLQQLGCLPPQSAAILPPSYRPLVLDAASPIIEFYPPSFSIDMNNKKNPWEGVNLIPFTDEQRMRDAIVAWGCDAKLTAEERRRNAFKPARLYCYSPQKKGTVLFPFATTLFGKIEPNHCVSYVFQIPPPQAPQETVLQLAPLRGNMLIHLKDKAVREENVEIVATGRASKHATLVVTIPSRVQPAQVTVRLLQALARNCRDRLVTYPYGMTRYAIIKGLWTRNYHVVTSPNASGVFVVSPLTADQARDYSGLFDRMPDEALRGRPNVIGLGGLDIHDCCILAEIAPILGVERRRSTHTPVYRYAADTLLYPLQLVTPASSLYFDSLALMDRPLTERLAPGTPCVFLGTNVHEGRPLQGAFGVCEKVTASAVTLRLTRVVPGIATGTEVLRSAKEERWYSCETLRRLLQIPLEAVLRITGSYRVYDRGSFRGDIGLHFHDRTRVIPSG